MIDLFVFFFLILFGVLKDSLWQMLEFISCLLIFPYHSVTRFCCYSAAWQLTLAVCWAKMCRSPIWLHSFLMAWFREGSAWLGEGEREMIMPRQYVWQEASVFLPQQLHKMFIKWAGSSIFFFLFGHFPFSASFSAAAGIKLSMFFCCSSAALK